jgi:hypothetical protein
MAADIVPIVYGGADYSAYGAYAVDQRLVRTLRETQRSSTETKSLRRFDGLVVP